MKKIIVNGNEYKIKYGFNSFADTDLLERVGDITALINGAKDDSDVSAMGEIRNLFCIVRELLFVGFEKYNPVDSLQEVGNLLDDYFDEAPEGENRGLISLFGMLSEELTDEGFFSDFVEKMNSVATPQDHKKKATRKATK